MKFTGSNPSALPIGSEIGFLSVDFDTVCVQNNITL